jgi:hypothetical protein
LVATEINILQNEIAAIQTGISHEEGVIDVLNGPPGTVKEGDRFIVGPAPTADFAGHANAVAELVAGVWNFELPDVGDAHFVDNQGYTVIWNGTAWIQMSRQTKVALQALPPSNPIPGDIWLDNTNPTAIIQRFWTGSLWISTTGSRVFVRDTDPALDPAIVPPVNNGDIWVQTP